MPAQDSEYTMEWFSQQIESIRHRVDSLNQQSTLEARADLECPPVEVFDRLAVERAAEHEERGPE